MKGHDTSCLSCFFSPPLETTGCSQEVLYEYEYGCKHSVRMPSAWTSSALRSAHFMFSPLFFFCSCLSCKHVPVAVVAFFSKHKDVFFLPEVFCNEAFVTSHWIASWFPIRCPRVQAAPSRGLQCAVYHKNGRPFTSGKGVNPVKCVWMTNIWFQRQLTHLGRDFSPRLPRQLCHQQPAWFCCCLIFTSRSFRHICASHKLPGN